jgi:hypothetical protein
MTGVLTRARDDWWSPRHCRSFCRRAPPGAEATTRASSAIPGRPRARRTAPPRPPTGRRPFGRAPVPQLHGYGTGTRVDVSVRLVPEVSRVPRPDRAKETYRENTDCSRGSRSACCCQAPAEAGRTPSARTTCRRRRSETTMRWGRGPGACWFMNGRYRERRATALRHSVSMRSWCATRCHQILTGSTSRDGR